MKQTEKEYYWTIDQWILELVRKGIQEFDDILLSLPGVYPQDVFLSIQRLTDMQYIPKQIFDKANYYVSKSTVATNPGFLSRSLPVPHPLDFAWRFSRKSVNFLLETCYSLLKYSRGKIILLGSPTVLQYLDRHFLEEDFILIDSDPLIAEKLAVLRPRAQVQCWDLSIEAHFSIQGDVVIVDPPWYPEYIHSFLSISTKLIKKNGIILLSFPADGTRPNIKHERKQTLDWASEMGLILVGISELRLSYVSPPFERNALSAVGIKNIPCEWRRSDLIIFRSNNENGDAIVKMPKSQNEWYDYSTGDVRIRVRGDYEEQFMDPRLDSIVIGDILPSVSRRDPRRKGVDVWTSGNRVFSCKGKATFVNILKSITQKVDPCQTIEEYFKRSLSYEEKVMVEAARKQILEVLHLEHVDICKYYWE